MSAQLLNTPAKHASSLSSLADNAWTMVREAAFATAWTPAARLAEAAVVALMQNITHGQLRVLTTSHIYTFPAPGSKAERENDMPELKAELRVVNDVFWLRLCTMSDLGFAEAYMYGDVECDDLVTLFLMFLYNRSNLASLNTKVSYLFTLPQKITSYRFLNTIGNSRSNISAHYDISNEMFAGFLSSDMTYSCAIFDTLDGDLLEGSRTADRGAWSGGQALQRVKSTTAYPGGDTKKASPETDELHSAQLRKLQHIIQRARILPGQRVLEIGSGWGSLAILIAQSVPGTEVDSLTLSSAQRELALERIREAGLEGRVRIHLMDYRHMPAEWAGAFDRVVSVEMAEAVGKEYLETYWGKIEWAMKAKGAAGVIQCITIPEPRFERYMAEIDFIRKWIFPGGFLPTLTFLMETLGKGSKSRLIVDSVSNIGPHYARTLREWRRRFLARFEDVVVPALRREHPDLMTGGRGREEIEVFKRKWIYYYCYCEVGFTTRTLGDHIITFTREGYEEYGCQVFE